MDSKGFKAYYEKYWVSYTVDQDQFKEVMNRWRVYREKILKEELTAAEYNSKNEIHEKGQYSLRQFIERESTQGFFGRLGSIISGKLVLWVTNNESGDIEIYYNKVKLNTEEEILEAEKKINEFLKKIVTAYKWEDLLNFLSTSEIFDSIASKAFIFEIVFLNSLLKEDELTEDEQKDEKCRYDYRNKLIQIYEYDDLEKVECFKALKRARDTNSYLDPFVKSRKLFDICKDALELKEEDITGDTIFVIERAAWEVSHHSNDYVKLIANNKNIVFYGAPGTGKTYTVKRAIDSLNGSKNTIFVQFHPSFSYEDFIEGIKPLGTDANGNLKVGPVNGIFKELCIKAKANPEETFYFVADEINRANLSAVFGETLSLIENDYRYLPKKSVDENKKEGRLIKTPLSGLLKATNADDKLAFAKDADGEVFFGIPENIVFIGMMNDADKSIDSFDLALRRRFVWALMSYDEKALVSILLDAGLDEAVIEKYISACKRLNYYITGVNNEKTKIDLGKGNEPIGLGRQFEIGHAIFKNIASADFCWGSRFRKNALEDFFDGYLSFTLTEYLRTYATESELADKIKLAKEIFVGNDGE